MRLQLRFALAALLSASLATVALAADKKPAPSPSPAPATYLITNDDDSNTNSYDEFFHARWNPNRPDPAFSTEVNTGGLGLGGGFFPLPRLALPVDGSSPCAYASNAGTGDLAGLNIQTKAITGNFTARATMPVTRTVFGLAVNDNYLYVGYRRVRIPSARFLYFCQLSFLGDTPAAGLNRGSVSGMASHGQILVITYADGSSSRSMFSNGIPVSNGDEQNSTAFNRNSTHFPEGVDITAGTATTRSLAIRRWIWWLRFPTSLPVYLGTHNRLHAERNDRMPSRRL